MRKRSAAHVKSPVKEHVDNRLPFLNGHLVEHPIAQDARVVYEYVDPSKGIHCCLNNARRRIPLCDTVGIFDGNAARRLDFPDESPRDAVILRRSSKTRTDIINYNACALRSRCERKLPTYAPARTGDNDNFILEPLNHPILPHS